MLKSLRAKRRLGRRAPERGPLLFAVMNPIGSHAPCGLSFRFSTDKETMQPLYYQSERAEHDRGLAYTSKIRWYTWCRSRIDCDDAFFLRETFQYGIRFERRGFEYALDSR